MGGRGRQISEFEASLVYRVSSRTARATQKNPVSKKQKKNKTKKSTSSQLVVAHFCSPSTLEGRGRWISEFEASLDYRVSSRTARATQRNPVSKKQKKTKKKNTTKPNKNKQTNKQKNDRLWAQQRSSVSNVRWRVITKCVGIHTHMTHTYTNENFEKVTHRSITC